MAALPSVAGWLAVAALVCLPAGPLALAGGKALVGACGDRAVVVLLGLVGELALAGLDPGLDGPFGDGGGALLGELLVFLESGAGHPGRERLDLFPAADPAPLLREGGADRPREGRVEPHELARLAGTHPTSGHRRRAGPVPAVPLKLRRGSVSGLIAVAVAAGWAAELAACLALVLADRAVAAGPTAVLQRPLARPGGAGPDPREPEADPGLGDNLHQPGARAALMCRQAPVEVIGPAGVVARVLVALVEVQQVHRSTRSMPVGRRPPARRRRRAGRDPARAWGDGLSAHRRLPVPSATARRCLWSRSVSWRLAVIAGSDRAVVRCCCRWSVALDQPRSPSAVLANSLLPSR